MKHTMKRAILIFLLSLSVAVFGETYKATTCGQSLLFTIPDGWRKATPAELVAATLGLSNYDSEGISVFSAIVRTSSESESATSSWRGMLALAFIDDVSDEPATEELFEALSDVLRENLRAVSGVPIGNELMSVKFEAEAFETHDDWAGMWTTQRNIFNEKLFPDVAKLLYSYIGIIIIDGKLYMVTASSASIANDSDKIAFKEFAYKWMRDMISINRGNAASHFVEPTNRKSPKLTDQRVAGDISGLTVATFTDSDVRKLLYGDNITYHRMSELIPGIRVNFSCPKAIDSAEKLERPQLFHGSYASQFLKSVVFFDVFLEDVSEGANLIINALGSSNITDEQFYDTISSYYASNGNGNLVGAGMRTIDGMPCFWYTQSLSNLPFKGRNISSLKRIYSIPLPGESKLLNFSFHVFNVSSTQLPVADFERLYPFFDAILNSITISGTKPNTSLNDKTETDTPIAYGTGWYVTSNHVATCWHVVRKAQNPVLVTEDGTEVKLELVAKDELNDLAVMKVRDRHFRCDNPLTLAQDMDASVAESVFTVGFPEPELMGKEPKYSIGVVSALSGLMDDKSQYQISTPIQPGNSGGAVVDEKGEVIGIVQGSLTGNLNATALDTIPQNVNYATKVKYLRKLLVESGIGIPSVTPERNPTSKEAYTKVKSATVFILVK